MAKEKQIVIKEAKLTNNCPECFNTDLTLTFFQKLTSGAFFHRITSEVSRSLVCNKCGSTIYPVAWTDEIENSVRYFEKLATPRKSRVRVTYIFIISVVFILSFITMLVYAYLEGII
ncbi:MAG: hypothetical protein OER83_00160 [Flavobacteriaceae bacterium]|nr:hypothetical protein [Flavobacteriaceae bacterium]MDH3795261.1 hypothetical protein [Flavobacteriaceae bacterium]